MALEQKENTSYLSVLASAGDFRMTVPQGTEGAKRRDYETSDGKTGSKWELAYKSIGGYITKIDFFDGDYGKNLLLTFDFKDGTETVTVSLGTNTPFGEDMLKKLPNIDFSKEVKLTPYAFTDDKGKDRKGISVVQADCNWNDDKVPGAFYDPEKKENLLGFPEPEGDTTAFDTDDWKIYFTQCRKFLVKYAEEHIDEWIPKKTEEPTATEDEEL